MLTAWLVLCGITFWTKGEAVGDNAVTNGYSNPFRYARAKASSCKPQWHPFGEKCYKILGLGDLEKLNWEDAAKSCSNIGGNLATVHSQDLQDYLIAFLLLNASVSVWIGLHDRINESRYSWHDGSRVNFTNWGEMEPSGPKLGSEDCVEMMFFLTHSKLGKWNDADCSRKLSYLCQMNKGTSMERFQDPRFCSSSSTGWSLHGFCYFIHTDAKSWTEAEDFCLSNYQGHLATVNGMTIDVFLDYVLRDYKVKTMWIGISMKQKPLKWSSGWHVFNIQWKEKYLLENDYVEGSCISLSKDKRWIGDSCRRKLPFICETSTVMPPKLNPPPNEDYHCPEEPSDWMDLGGQYCYFIQFKDYVSWYEASYHCMRRGGTLISFHSMEEVLGIEQFLRYTRYILHMGLFRKLDSEEFVWADGSKENFLHWAKDEPNSKDENCTEFQAESMRWNDIPCDTQRGYVCAVRKIEPSIETEENKDTCKSGLSPFEMLALTFCVGLVLLLLGAVIYYFKKPDQDQTRKTSMVHLQLPVAQRYTSDEIVIREDESDGNVEDIIHRNRKIQLLDKKRHKTKV